MNEHLEMLSENYPPPPRRVVRREEGEIWRWSSQCIGGAVVSLILSVLGLGLARIASISTFGLSTFGVALLLFGEPTLIFYCLALSGIFLDMHLHHRLVKWGNPATAVVTHNQRDPRRGKQLKYQFEDECGFSVEVCLTNLSIAMRYKDAGTRFPVLYLPASPEISLPCEDLSFTAGSARDGRVSRSKQNNVPIVRLREILDGIVDPLLCLGVGAAQIVIGFVFVFILSLICSIPKILHLLVR